MDALNRAFEKAFAHTATKETLMELLDCLGSELECDRIAIFEFANDATFSNTYEWCHEGIAEERTIFKHVPIHRLDSWLAKIQRNDVIVITDLNEIKESDPDIYGMLKGKKVSSIIVSHLAFHGKNIGFFVIENPASDVISEKDSLMPGMRYILSSLVYSDHLIHKLDRLNHSDPLTGARTRVSLRDHLKTLTEINNIGIVYAEAISWNKYDNKYSVLKEDQMLIHTGNILIDVFGEDSVFRIAENEFLVLQIDISQDEFNESIKMMKILLNEQKLVAAIGSLWTEHPDASPEAMIRQTHMKVTEEHKKLTENQVQNKRDELDKKLWGNVDNAQIDLLRGDDYFREAANFLTENSGDPIILVALDINYFKLYNDIFGRKSGNAFLESIADAIRDQTEKLDGICGYLGGDDFCFMFQTKETEHSKITPIIDELVNSIKYADGFAPALGIYLSVDREESLVTMYDRAMTALSSIKGSYMEHYRFYDAEYFRHDRDSKLLLMEVKEGLKNNEFIFYVQPQVHGQTAKIVGCEALIRWKSKGQLVPPNRFIPELEKSGYIFTVDCFVWEAVVKWLKSLIERGIKPVPCSVNVSRVDFFFTDIADHFIELVKKYEISPSLLGIEITETAFTDNTDSILKSVQKLHDFGFSVYMDDFGSGSSSLSMLHTMQLDVLKTDVKFMSQDDSDVRAISIVESVINMAHMIGMVVVAEGVETKQQWKTLAALGSNYAQGYYFYRPMSIEDFEKLLQDPDKIGNSPKKAGNQMVTNHLQFKDMIRDGLVSETLLENILGAAAIYKISGDKVSIVQINQHYTKLTGIEPGDDEGLKKFLTGVQIEGADNFLHNVDAHILEGLESSLKLNGEEIHARTFLLYTCDDHKLYLSTLQRAE